MLVIYGILTCHKNLPLTVRLGRTIMCVPPSNSIAKAGALAVLSLLVEASCELLRSELSRELKEGALEESCEIELRPSPDTNGLTDNRPSAGG